MMLSAGMRTELWPAAGEEEPLVGKLPRCPTSSPESHGAFLKTLKEWFKGKNTHWLVQAETLYPHSEPILNI